MSRERDIDLEAALDYFKEQNQIRQDALETFIKWVESEARAGRFPVPESVIGCARRAFKGNR